jgi:type II secretory pathway component PulC
MESFMKLKRMGAAGLVALALGCAGAPAYAASPDEQEARKELDRARQEVEKARVELQRATRELARSLARTEKENPRAQYFEYMTDPKRAVLGVLISDEIENGEDSGVRLLAVTPGSGAEKAGLKAGDLLVALNGNALAREGKEAPQTRMKEALRKLKAGDTVKVDYERDGKRSSTVVTTKPPEPELALAPFPMLQEWLHDEDFGKFGALMPGSMAMFNFRGTAIRGLELAKLDADLGAYFKTKDGVLVVKAPKSGALGLKSGDVIQKIDGDAVTEPVTVLDKLRSRGDEQSVKLEIMRQGRKQELEGKIPVADARPRRDKRQRIEIIEEHDEDDDGT